MILNSKERHSALIKRKATELGFSFCGISKADFLEEESRRLDLWLKDGYHGKMSYMENHYDKRLDPRLLVEDAKSVVSLLFNYSRSLYNFSSASRSSSINFFLSSSYLSRFSSICCCNIIIYSTFSLSF